VRVADLKILLGAVETRTITNKGIAWNNLQYNSDELGWLKTRLRKNCQINFKYDPLDIGLIHVADPETNRYFAVPALAQEYAAGLTLWQHEVIQRYARMEIRKDFSLSDLCNAKEKIRRIVERDWLKNAKTGHRKKIGRLIDYGGDLNRQILGGQETTPTQNFLSPMAGSATPELSTAAADLPDSHAEPVDESELDTSGWEGSYTLPSNFSEDEELEAWLSQESNI
jgi:putative transposase